MKLSDIVIQEAAPEGDKPLELKEVKKYFPNTFEKAVKTLAKSGRLMWNGKLVFTKSGDFGPALEEALASAQQFLNDEDNTVDITIEMDGSVADLDDGGDFTADYPLNENQEVYAGYSMQMDRLLIGFDCWLDEEIFNQDWNKEFEQQFGEDYDHENSAHEKIFNKAHKEWKKNSFMGALVIVDDDGSCDLDAVHPGGFYKGVHRSPSFKHERAIDFRLD